MCRTRLFSSWIITEAHPEQEDPEGAPMTGAVVAPGDGAEHRSPEAEAFHGGVQLPPAARHWVPNGELAGSHIRIRQENPAMAEVERFVLRMSPVGDARCEFRGGDEMCGGVFLLIQPSLTYVLPDNHFFSVLLTCAGNYGKM